MDRKSQIFAPTISAGGVRKPARKPVSNASASTNQMLKKVCDEMKNEIHQTILNSFSYKSGDKIYNVNDAKIKSIGKNKKHVAFLISGNTIEVDEKQAMKEFSESQMNKEDVTEIPEN